MVNKVSKTNLIGLLENFQKKGRITFTKEEIITSINISENAFRQFIFRLSKKGKIQKISNGFYVIIPIEYQLNKVLPPTMYIDNLMKYHNIPYYVGLLSAATYHGATHQAAQELQIMTLRPLRTITFGRVKIKFFTKKNIKNSPIEKINVPTGQINVSTPEMTAFDLIHYCKRAGGLNHVATVFAELKGKLKVSEMIKLCKQSKDLSFVQRLGYLLEFTGEKKCSLKIKEWLLEQDTSFVKLQPSASGKILKKNDKWKILINTKIEADEV